MGNLDFPLERYGLIAELAHKMKERGFAFGKTALQKLVFFLQELFGVDAGYDFSLYTYGPFDSTLLSDLESAAALDGVDVKYYGQQGYQISPGAENDSVRKHATKLTSKHSKAIDQVVDEFGSMWARKLELFATVVYVERDARASGERIAGDRLVSVVNELKPHFSEDEIRAAIKHLLEKNYIELATEEPALTKRSNMH